MTLFDFLRLVYRNWKALVIMPLVMAIAVFLLTRNQPKSYAAGSLIYTGIASGYNIESGDGDKVDYFAVNNAFDNLLTVIKSSHTLAEVGLRLLAQHLHESTPTHDHLDAVYFALLEERFPSAQRAKYMGSSEQETFHNLREAYESEDPMIIEFIRKGNTPYSITALSRIEAKRHKSSDMVEVYFTSFNPWVSQQTVVFLIEVFTRRYKEVKEAETGNVVAYFEEELRNTKNKLSDAEDRLTDFRVQNQVINYGEQTKAIAIMKENAMNEYSGKKINLKATQAAVEEIESKLSIREKLIDKNHELLDRKNELAELTAKVALRETQNAPSLELDSLNAQITSTRLDIQKSMEDIFAYSNSKEGIPSTQLLNEWLNNIIQLNKDKVHVKVFNERLDELDAEYDHFAPLGSTIARLEREIDVFEREYLEILHGLNMSKLRQQNIEMSSNLEVVDWPLRASEPLPSKRKLLIIVAFMLGVFAPLSFIVATELLDNTLKNPEKAEKITGLEVAGAIPVLNEKFKKEHSHLLPILLDQLTSSLETNLIEENRPKIVLISSALACAGKTHITKLLVDRMNERGKKTALVCADDQNEIKKHTFTYRLESNRDITLELQDLIASLDHYEFVIVDLPSAASGALPVNLFGESDLSLIISRADKIWSKAHLTAVKNIEKTSKKKPLLVLNGVKLHFLDQLLGEFNTKRPVLIRWVKKVVKLELTPSQFKAA